MKALKISGIVIGALIITALGIDAADTINGNGGTLLSNVINAPINKCPDGMKPIEGFQTFNCVDMYEATAAKSCPVADPGNMFDTQQNLESNECMSESKVDAVPWRFITREQAMQACAKANKRLPTAAEWYSIVVGMQNVETNCNVNGSLMKSGSLSECVSPKGAYDMVGNVWEWVSDDIFNGVYNGHSLPLTGYVAQVDGTGVAVDSATTTNPLFGDDYIWSNNEGAYGMIRGGFYGSEADAGVYAVHADTLPTTAGTAIGFRCVK